jgi:hypothetical protein
MGASQQLQIRTWTPQLRMAQTVPFQWKPRVWYRMKFRTAVEKDEAGKEKAVLKGKVWEKGNPEPKEWHVVAEDPSPNLTSAAPACSATPKTPSCFTTTSKCMRTMPSNDRISFL